MSGRRACMGSQRASGGEARRRGAAEWPGGVRWRFPRPLCFPRSTVKSGLQASGFRPEADLRFLSRNAEIMQREARLAQPLQSAGAKLRRGCERDSRIHQRKLHRLNRVNAEDGAVLGLSDSPDSHAASPIASGNGGGRSDLHRDGAPPARTPGASDTRVSRRSGQTARRIFLPSPDSIPEKQRAPGSLPRPRISST